MQSIPGAISHIKTDHTNYKKVMVFFHTLDDLNGLTEETKMQKLYHIKR